MVQRSTVSWVLHDIGLSLVVLGQGLTPHRGSSWPWIGLGAGSLVPMLGPPCLGSQHGYGPLFPQPRPQGSSWCPGTPFSGSGLQPSSQCPVSEHRPGPQLSSLYPVSEHGPRPLVWASWEFSLCGHWAWYVNPRVSTFTAFFISRILVFTRGFFYD